MKCEKCKTREATVLFKQTVNGETTTAHLCHECATEMQQGGFFSATPFPFGGNLFEGLFGISAPEKPAAKRSCPQCGATWSDLRREGKPRCAACYRAFSAELEPTLRSLYGTAAHTGRAPAKCRAQRSKQQQAILLKKQLHEAVEAEEYEEPARLRDELRKLEKEEN